MSHVMVDVEADGPIPGDYSMVALGAVIVEPGLARDFRAQLRPVSQRWLPGALAVSGYSRGQTLGFEPAETVIPRFIHWVKRETRGRATFVSDNNGFDWQFVNWYCHHFCGENPFGYSSMNLGSLYKGLVRDTFQNFKHLRRTTHTHDPLEDARGNAEALLAMKDQLGLKIRW